MRKDGYNLNGESGRIGELPSFSDADETKTRIAYRLYLCYVTSFFLHLTARIPFLGLIHLDMILVGLVAFMAYSSAPRGRHLDRASAYLIAILIFSLLELPLVTWPGSVLKHGIEAFIKGIIFYFFTVKLIRTEKRLMMLVFIFVACNSFRVFEPLYLHITTGYWGSRTFMGGQFENRLQGSPYDIVGADGLAFVIVSVLPFYHYILGGSKIKLWKILYLLSAPLLLYAMLLTLSRSGLLAVGITALSIFIKSRHKVLLAVIGIVGLSIGIANLTGVQQNRYLSIVNHDVPGGKSAAGRLDAWVWDFNVAMDRPIFGHGLGTSREANFHFRNDSQPAHNLWLETWQEIGLIGVILVILYVKTLIQNFNKSVKYLKGALSNDDILYRLASAMQVWLYMNILFSLASFGLTDYEWYLFGGLSVVVLDIAKQRKFKGSNRDEVAINGEWKKHGLANFSRTRT